MTQSLPPSPNLEFLKKAAKALLEACQGGERTALERVEAFTSSADLKLADAQYVIAREYGFPNWARLKTYLEALRPQAVRATPRRQYIQTLALTMLEAARTLDLETLTAMLAVMPLRDILALRERVVQMGLHAVLVDGLLAGLRSEHARMRYIAAGALDHLADERCAEPLRLALHDPVPRVRRAALHSLGCDACKLEPLSVPDDLVPTLIEIFWRDPNARVRAAALEALCNRCPDPRAVETLRALLPLERNQGRARFIAQSLRRFVA